jgi:hypothetical protein
VAKRSRVEGASQQLCACVVAITQSNVPADQSGRAVAPFDDPNWIFEVKFDGFRYRDVQMSKLTSTQKTSIGIVILVGASMCMGLQARGWQELLDVDTLRKFYTLHPEQRPDAIRGAEERAKACIEYAIGQSLGEAWQEAYLVTTSCIRQYHVVFEALGYGEEQIKKNFDAIWVQVRCRDPHVC